MKKNSATMRKTVTHDDMNSSDVDEELEQFAADMEEMYKLSSGGRSKGDEDYKSVDLAGFFSSDDGEEEEEILDNLTDREDIVGDDEPEEFYRSGYGSDPVKSNGGHAGVKRWKRMSSCPNSLQRSKPFNSSATGASVMSSYPSPPHGNTKSGSEPIDIFYVGSDCRDESFNSLKKGYASRNIKARRNLLTDKEDWRDKAWQRKRDQVLSEEIILSDHCSDQSQSSKTTPRTRSFTNVDLDELKGCLDLGFGFNYEEMPELSNTLPALELCYVMGQKFQDDNHHKASPVSTLDNADSPRGAQSPIANWKISSPGDHPQQVKERLKVWAQAVACTARLFSS